MRFVFRGNVFSSLTRPLGEAIESLYDALNLIAEKGYDRVGMDLIGGLIMASEAQRKANAKYKEKCKGKFVEMRYRVSIEERDAIKAYCDAHNVSVSDFTRELVFEKITSQ